jgi:hypothetical protein
MVTELLAYAALASVGIKAQQPNYDFKTIFTSGAADIAELAYGRTGDDGVCLSYQLQIVLMVYKRNLKRAF